jgi:hypothetical protein
MNKWVRFLAKLSLAGVAAAILTVIPAHAFHKGVVHGGGGGVKTSKLVFVTKETFTGNLGGLEGADSMCQGFADGEGLTGRFKAWLSASGQRSPSNRFVRSSSPYVDPLGGQIALNWADLTDGALHHVPIILFPDGALVVEPYGVWTGTMADGRYESRPNCIGWSSADPDEEGLGGLIYWSEGPFWSNALFVRCDLRRRLYCFQQ